MRICTIEWCCRKFKCKWYCDMHYQRYKRYWDPLLIIWFIKWEDKVKHTLYSTYHNMKCRCYNENTESYKYYWWRWIKICDRWLWQKWFKNFCEDMGERPEWMTIDRIDNNQDYCIENCKWSSIYQQNWNLRSNNKNVWVWLNKKSNKWKSYIKVNKKLIHLWYYIKYEDALKSRKEAELKYNIY